MNRSGMLATALGVTLILAACGESQAPSATATSPGGAAASVQPTGTVHEVKMISGGSERFEPADITAKRGDVIRFVLVAGVHNASFPADKNPAGVKLPAATPYLQAPGQTHDLVVDLPVGEYNFHCDPHAVLGMVGTLTVTN